MLPPFPNFSIAVRRQRKAASDAPISARPITREEFAALKQIDDAREYETIPVEIQERLILIGYVEEVLGGLIVTDEGMLRIVTGNLKGTSEGGSKPKTK